MLQYPCRAFATYVHKRQHLTGQRRRRQRMVIKGMIVSLRGVNRRLATRRRNEVSACTRMNEGVSDQAKTITVLARNRGAALC